MKADVYALKRPEKPVREFVFKQGDWEARIVLRRQGVMASSAHLEKANEMYAKYVTGSGPIGKDGRLDTKAAAYVAPRPLPLVDGQPVELTFNTCQVVSAIEIAQVWDDIDEKYTFEELCGMAAVDEFAEVFLDAYEWVLPQPPKHEEVKDDDQGNPSTVLSLSTDLDGSTSTP